MLCANKELPAQNLRYKFFNLGMRFLIHLARGCLSRAFRGSEEEEVLKEIPQESWKESLVRRACNRVLGLLFF